MSCNFYAQVAELVDALDSKSSVGNIVRVQVPPWAPYNMQILIDNLLEIILSWGYLGIFVAMAIESSFIPLPAELIITPAAYLAYQGKMNIYLIVVFGVLGSLVGALFNYFIAHFLGKKLIYALVDKPWARFFLLNRESLAKSEGYFLKYGEVSTFIGRMIPVVRHLISLPAGFVGMNLISFSIYTILGASISLSMLAALGYFFGENQALLESYYHEITIGIIALVVLAVVVVLLKKLVASRRVSVE